MAGRYCAFALVPFLGAVALVAAMNFVVDPYALTGRNRLGIDRAPLADHANDRLYRLSSYKAQPCGAIVLGDSRTKNLDVKYFAAEGANVCNLAFSAGTLFEAIDAFWFATRHGQVTHVVLGVPFEMWSETNDNNLVTGAEEFIDHPARYFINGRIFLASVKSVEGKLRGDSSVSSAPPMTREEFWRYQLEYSAPSFYLRSQRPQRLEKLLRSVVDYCRANGIHLVFLIPPTHVDLQRKIDFYGLRKNYDEYVAMLESLAPVLNYNVEDPLTQDADNFLDPFHATPEVCQWVAADIVRRVRLPKSGT